MTDDMPDAPAVPTAVDERLAVRMVLAIVDRDETAARAALDEAHAAGRETLLLIALARYGAKLSESTMPEAGEQLRGILLGLAEAE